MECTEAELLAEKYEFGELSKYKKRSFEHHVKNCKKCHAKYGTILLLGVLIGSSTKSAELSATSGSLSLVLKSKIVIVVTVLAMSTLVGSVAFDKTRDSSKVEKIKVEESIILKKLNEKNDLVEKIKTENKVKTFKIISKSEEKEVEITIDNKSLRMENRFEK